MDMGMRNLEPGDHDPDSFAGDRFLDRFGDFFGKDDQAFQSFVLDIKNIIHLLLGDDEGMAGIHGPNVEKGKVVFIFKDLVGRYLSLDDACKK